MTFKIDNHEVPDQRRWISLSEVEHDQMALLHAPRIVYRFNRKPHRADIETDVP